MAGERQGPVTREEYAYSVIRDDILRGRLRPGERLNQDELARNLGISKIPIRAALHKLESEELIEMEHHKGARVVDLSIAELREVYLIRNRLERLAVELVSAKELGECEEQVEKWLRESEAEAERGMSWEYIEANRRFHMGIYAASEKPSLLRIIEQLWNRSLKYRMTYLRARPNIARSIEQHRQLWAFIKSGEAEAAADLIVVHNQATERFLLRSLQGRTQPETGGLQ